MTTKTKKGSVLVYSLIIMIIMLVMALGVTKVVIRDTQISSSTAKSTQAIQASNSGIEEILGEINVATELSTITSIWPSCSSGIVSGTLSNGTDYEVIFYNLANGGTQMSCTDLVKDIRLVKSTGYSDDVARALEVAIQNNSNTFGIGTFRDGSPTSWYLDTNFNGEWNSGDDTTFSFGSPGDVAISGDWNGNGGTTIGIHRNGSFFLRNSNSTGTHDIFFNYGLSTDLPISGDWDGDGDTTVGVFRPSNQYFYLRSTNDSSFTTTSLGPFGSSTDIPVTGDWDGDGQTDIGVYRVGSPSVWYLDLNANGLWDSGIDGQYSFGSATHIPVTGDWDGDGVTDIGTYVAGTWYIDVNGNRAWDAGVDETYSFGGSSDQPVTGKWW